MLKDAIIRFDTQVTIAMQQWPSWLHTPMVFITTLGQPAMLGIVALIIGYLAWQQGHMRIAVGLGIGIFAMGANMLLKHYVHRPRPDTLYVSNMFFKTSSFPSGHAFGAAVICGLLGYLAAKYMPGPWNIVLPIGLALFTVAVGVSRVYLGAHYPTDVIAGWLLGGLTAAIILLCLRP